jgi:hypothetical protein
MSAKNDEQELQELLTKRSDFSGGIDAPVPYGDHGRNKAVEVESSFTGRPIQFSSSDGTAFYAAGTTSPELSPGVYDILVTRQGICFNKVPMGDEKLIIFPDTSIQRVVNEIQKFWSREEQFKKFKVVYKRGILMWGPPGSGKTCALKLITRDIVSRGGVIFKMDNPDTMTQGVRLFRQIQPETPIMILIEDIDATIKIYNESDLLNLLDGFEATHKIVFVATTNYPEELGPRIVNRPSRFDKRFKIGYPSATSRRIYLEAIAGDAIGDIDVEAYIRDTNNNMSFAHLKELFTAHYIMGDSYEDAVLMINSMKEVISSDQDVERRTGFGRKATECHFADPDDDIDPT